MTRGHTRRLPLFAGAGLELEYMLVDRTTLAVRPRADTVLRHARLPAATPALALDHELVRHVIEIRTRHPVSTYVGVADALQTGVRALNNIAQHHGTRLMPTAMHPWMQPSTETRLWPHRDAPIYRAFHRIFDCARHGWANLQSCQLNLPFANDAEFARLHAAVRVLLPLLPAVAASSPYAEGRRQAALDYRVVQYCANASRIPSVVGLCIPEPCHTRAAYQRLLRTIYSNLAPHDPRGTLQKEWVNARGAIARFDRWAMEIRLVDMQECPAADVALAHAMTAILRALVAERWVAIDALNALSTAQLRALLDAIAVDADRTHIQETTYLRALGWKKRSGTARDLWHHLVDATWDTARDEPDAHARMLTLLEAGPLARRIARAVGRRTSRARLRAVYRELCDCLVEGQLFGV